MSRLLRFAATAASLIVLAPALAACGSDTAEIESGDVIQARDDAQFVEGTPSIIALPIGRLEVFFGEPVTALAAEDTRSREKLDAPDGSAFVPITWQYDAATFGDLTPYLGEPKSPKIDLVVNQARYRLPPPEATGKGSESFYALVSGANPAPSLRVEYDGVTQTVDLTDGERDEGAAAPLYDIKGRSKSRDCAAGATYPGTEGRVEFTCKITKQVRLPYAAGQWADDGHSYLAMTIDTKVRRFDIFGTDLRSGGTYLASGVESQFSFGDTEPVQAVQVTAGICPDEVNGGCTGRFHVVFDVTNKKKRRLEIDQTVTLRLASQWGAFDRKKQLKVDVTTSARVG